MSSVYTDNVSAIALAETVARMTFQEAGNSVALCTRNRLTYAQSIV